MTDKWFDLDSVAERGTAVAVVGQAGAGKTTLIRSLVAKLREIGIGRGDIVRGVGMPFPVLVHVPKSVLREYHGIKGIRRSFVEPDEKRFNYIVSRYRQAFVIIEDITAWLSTMRREELLRNIFSLRRKPGRRYVLMVSTESISDLFDFVDRFSHIILIGKGHRMFHLKQVFDPNDCRQIAQATKLATEHDYLINIVRADLITQPFDTRDPFPVLYSLVEDLGKIATYEVDTKGLEMMGLIQPEAGKSRPQLEEPVRFAKLLPRYLQIGMLIRDNPYLPYTKVAKMFTTSRDMVKQAVASCKSIGLLDGNKVYGARPLLPEELEALIGEETDSNRS